MILIPMISCIGATIIVMVYPVQEYKKVKGADGKKSLALEDELVS